MEDLDEMYADPKDSFAVLSFPPLTLTLTLILIEAAKAAAALAEAAALAAAAEKAAEEAAAREAERMEKERRAAMEELEGRVEGLGGYGLYHKEIWKGELIGAMPAHLWGEGEEEER